MNLNLPTNSYCGALEISQSGKLVLPVTDSCRSTTELDQYRGITALMARAGRAMRVSHAIPYGMNSAGLLRLIK